MAGDRAAVHVMASGLERRSDCGGRHHAVLECGHEVGAVVALDAGQDYLYPAPLPIAAGVVRPYVVEQPHQSPGREVMG
jgi:hypothetical protein